MANFRRLLDSILDRRLPTVPSLSLSDTVKLELCRKHGDFSLAYSTAVQKNLKHFGDEDGYIAYATKMGYTFALGDPVAPGPAHRSYIERFVSHAAKPCFVQVRRETAATLADLGYRINHMGVDTYIPLATHTFAGKRNETVRYSERWLLNKNYLIVECDGTVTSPEQISSVSNDWRAGRIVSRREMCFLNRPFKTDLTPHMRRFVILDPDRMPIAILDFDPIFSAGTVVGYTAAFKRKISSATSHAEVGLTKFAADRFREEGRSMVTLGLSPLAAIAESGFAESKLWRSMFQRAFASESVNTKIFNLRGQAAFKRRFHGDEQPMYMASKRGTPTEMVALLRLLKTL